MRRICAGLFLISSATLLVEVLLTRIFDVLLWPNVSFTIISCALFGLGLGGLLDVLHAPPAPEQASYPNRTAFWFALSVWMLPIALNLIPFSFDRAGQAPVRQAVWFLLVYLVVLIPFVLSGFCICRVFSTAPRTIHTLYFWDLAGAAAGSAVLIPLLRPVGPERLFIGASLVALTAAVLFAGSRRWKRVLVAGVAFLVMPMLLGHVYLRLSVHENKRDVESAISRGQIEFWAWDPVSQIAVINQRPQSNDPWDRGKKHVAYDGGTQSSNFYPFDGNFAALRRNLSQELHYQFWQKGVLVSHYLRRGTGHDALIIGSAGGRETKAALMYGAHRIDAVEMVGTVVQLTRARYAAYIGDLFNRPEVHLHVGEGRTFLRASRRRYDVIQIFSNYTSSSVAAGSGALTPMYLLTTEAYEDYFTHLTGDGILQVSHHTYPRLVSTAAAAWRALGRSDFRAHVIVIQQAGQPGIERDLPTMLIKMSPWTARDVADVARFCAMPADGELPYVISENPLDVAHSFLPDAFYTAAVSPQMVRAAGVDLGPVSDDWPTFDFMRRSLRPFPPDRAAGLDPATAALLNRQLRRGWLPMDALQLIVPAGAGLLYGLLFVIVPMTCSRVGRESWTGKVPALFYFGLLGIAFIGLEVLFIQVFIQLIGYPLYTIAVVITTLLVGAGLGSVTSRRLIGPDGARWPVAFIGLTVTGLLNWTLYPHVTHAVAALATPLRAAATAALILPHAYFMGMPFPMGIRVLAVKPRGAIAWAWSINGLSSTLGSVIAVALSLWLGFRHTMLLLLGTYAIAGIVFGALYKRCVQPADLVSPAEPVTGAVPAPTEI